MSKNLRKGEDKKKNLTQLMVEEETKDKRETRRQMQKEMFKKFSLTQKIHEKEIKGR